MGYFPEGKKFWIMMVIACLICSGELVAEESYRELAMNAFKENEFDQAVELCKGHEEELFAKLCIAFCHTEKYALYKNKLDKEKADAILKVLQKMVSVENVDEIAEFTKAKDKPVSIKEARKLMSIAFKNIRSADNARLLIKYLSPEYAEDINKMALDSLVKYLSVQRNYVNKGGTLPLKERELLQSPEFIQPLVNLINSDARAIKCLILIEEPAISYLEQAPPGEAVTKALLGIEKAKANRLKKYPQSNWYSAIGKE